ncbi:MAG: hypothetical protein IIZ83_10135, partial [Oscillospiraceae bacterium]|nr:hypothetical protein [Oscillospiraceae bacterium]
LLGKLREHGLTQDDGARISGMSRSRFNAKVNGTGGAEFKLGEIVALKNGIPLTLDEASAIFLV